MNQRTLPLNRPLPHTADSSDAFIDLDRLVSAVLRRWKTLAICAVVFVIGGAAYLATATPLYTSMTQVAAETLGLPPAQVRFTLGRSDFPPAPQQGGSQTMASVGSAIRAACIAAKEEAARLAAILPAPRRWPPYGSVASSRVGTILNRMAFAAPRDD